ncbi:Hypothetical predicted protein [Octopus vulgaris]|uniref:Uncharacterized protein n=1 Tax=Octopus vulgaris TaxID=6645 RepID=A0AA36FKU2_OCTVU|nr:Hypothetical predicted protein [Octopus vulgaris]
MSQNFWNWKERFGNPNLRTREKPVLQFGRRTGSLLGNGAEFLNFWNWKERFRNPNLRTREKPVLQFGRRTGSLLGNGDKQRLIDDIGMKEIFITLDTSSIFIIFKG